MSSETDLTDVEEDARRIESGEEWSSDEAAAEQEAMMAEPRRDEGDRAASRDSRVAGQDAVPPQAGEIGEIPTGGVGGSDRTAAGDGPSVAGRPSGADRPFPDGSVAAVYAGQSPASGELYGGRSLISDEARSAYLGRWNGIQVSFVDDPGICVENAYTLTQEVGLALLESFTDRSSELADGWREAHDTERLRLVLKQYRDFLRVLLPR